MATQGIVSVVRGGQVVLKVITGSNGHLAKKLAKTIRKNEYHDAQSAYDAALAIGFGNEDNLVVMDSEGAIYSQGEDMLSPRYRATFNDPRFNPRWASGQVDEDCLVIVEV